MNTDAKEVLKVERKMHSVTRQPVIMETSMDDICRQYCLQNLRLKNTIIYKTLTYAPETWTLTKRNRKQLKVFERKVYRTILVPVYNNEKENWAILTNKKICASAKKPTIIEKV